MKKLSREVLDAAKDYTNAVIRLSNAVANDSELFTALYYPKYYTTDTYDRYDDGEFKKVSYQCGYPPIKVLFEYIKNNGYCKEDFAELHDYYMQLY